MKKEALKTYKANKTVIYIEDSTNDKYQKKKTK